MNKLNCYVGKSYGKEYYKAVHNIEVIEPEIIHSNLAPTVEEAGRGLELLADAMRSTVPAIYIGGILKLKAGPFSNPSPIKPCPGDELCEPHPVLGYPAEYCARCKKTR